MLSERLGDRYWRAKLNGESPGPSQTEIVEEAELQVNRLIELGFHHELDKTPDEYRRELAVPEGTVQPTHYRGALDTLLLVDPRVSRGQQCRLAKLSGWREGITDTVDVPLNPYAVWVARRSTLPQDFEGIVRFKEWVYEDLEGASMEDLIAHTIQLPPSPTAMLITKAMGARDDTDVSSYLTFRVPARDNIPYIHGNGIGSGWPGSSHMAEFGLFRGRQIVELGRSASK